MSTKQPFIPTGDEGDDHQAFEEYVGGVSRAFRLLDIYKNSYPHNPFPLNSRHNQTRDEVFRARAKSQGYDDLDVDAFLSIQ